MLTRGTNGAAEAARKLPAEPTMLAAVNAAEVFDQLVRVWP